MSNPLHDFKNPDLLKLALTHRSHGTTHNERLEFLGDAILSLVISDLLYQRYPKAPEGTLSALRAEMVQKQTLATIASPLNLKLHTSGSMHPPYSDTILASTLEALIGAIYLDAGLCTCKTIIEKHWQTWLERLTPTTFDKNPKSSLQEWCQQHQNPLPIYETIAISGLDHALTYDVTCTLISPAMTTHGRHARKQDAEQMAAKAMLNWLRKSS